jgi:hypothetical protein
MTNETSDIDAQIERLRNGGTLSELEVKNLCEKVCYDEAETMKNRHGELLSFKMVQMELGISGFKQPKCL